MKNNPLDDLIKCKVEISNPRSEVESFDKILIVVAQPDTPVDSKPMNKTITITGADDLVAYGYTTTSDAYKAATVVFAQNPAPSELSVYARKTSVGTNESIATALATANNESKFYFVHLTSFTDSSSIEEAVAFVEANEKILLFEYSNIEAFPFTDAQAQSLRIVCAFSGKPDSTSAEYNKFISLAWAAKCSTYQPGSETWALKELSYIVPSLLTNEDKTTLLEKNVNSFRRYAGSNITIGGSVLGGEWVDVIRFRDWLVAEIQKNVFNVLRVNKKVPFTDQGINLIGGAIEKALRDGQINGGIAITSFDDDGNEIPGYTVTLPKASDLTEAERAARKLTNVRYTARLAGAIHLVEIEGYLTF